MVYPQNAWAKSKKLKSQAIPHTHTEPAHSHGDVSLRTRNYNGNKHPYH